MKQLLPAMKELVMDSSQHVRSAMSSVAMDLAPLLGRQNTVDQLIPVFIRCLRDEFPEVRLYVISKLDVISNVIS